MSERIAVIGLGYVGLPVALAFARKFPGTVGFVVHREKVLELRRGYDRNHEVPEEVLKKTTLNVTCDMNDLEEFTFMVVAVYSREHNKNVTRTTPSMRSACRM